MRELVILSGKGGTGKTSLTAAFAALSHHSVLCDADVDAADLHLLMSPEIREHADFVSGGLAVIHPDLCTGCGQCRDLCRFDAINEDFIVSAIDCEGCGVCVDLCPVQAIDFPAKTCGEWYLSQTRFGPMVHAQLGIAGENSGKLVALVRQEARKLAESNNVDLLMTDGPPGVGCPVIASLGGATAILIVAEPTVSGIHDMERVTRLADHFKVPCLVCVNKSDLNPGNTRAIEGLAEKRGLPVVGCVPFDEVLVESMVQGRTVIEFAPESKAGRAIEAVWRNVLNTPIMNPSIKG